ncbi:hypothetical protein SISNIDRAFT_448066 [Sistotremastrum niveocremeum HHB9708]|uniref:Alpha N-terminal protein methyltransferase 1 n=1 Tax=Sistotremastrum niveocremeum HHB9708 TaxID=1314777 RepID=A0A165ALB6_9AGAM|nr:hypothetical protein SISNIDRAFT_448066 [Sistotremastrum niveocremeum HHB9708]
MRQPDLEDGIEYWNTREASYDGVLGGFGNGTLPRVDALGSRQFIMTWIPELCTVPSAIRPLETPATDPKRRYRALDVGCGVGRTTKDVLLHLVDDVVLVEPVHKFISVAEAESIQWKGIAEKRKSATFVQAPLQQFDPGKDIAESDTLGRMGFIPDSVEHGYDIIWCQWCLGHLNHSELVAFFKLATKSLRDLRKGFIFVKENLCRDMDDGSARVVFDEEDSSLTRSNSAWIDVFTEAGLTVREGKIQQGLPEGLYPVKMYALQAADSSLNL